MSQNAKRILLIIATVLILINLGIFVSNSVSSFITGSFIDDIILQLEYYLDASLDEYIDITNFRNLLSIILYFGAIISLALHIIIAVVFAKRINLNAQESQAKRASLIIWSIVCIIFGVSFFGGILGLIAGLISTTEIANNYSNQYSQEGQTENNGEIIEKINSLKKLKDSGAITDEEYGRLLSDLIK